MVQKVPLNKAWHGRPPRERGGERGGSECRRECRAESGEWRRDAPGKSIYGSLSRLQTASAIRSVFASVCVVYECTMKLFLYRWFYNGSHTKRDQPTVQVMLGPELNLKYFPVLLHTESERGSKVGYETKIVSRVPSKSGHASEQ